jgi:hypothetical protein
MTQKLLKPEVTITRLDGHKYRVYFTVGVQRFTICDSDKLDCTEMKMALEQAITRVLDGYRWKVVVDSRKSGTVVFYRTRFIVKNIPFLLALIEKAKDDPDGPQGARLHCLFIARMFKKALKNMGVKRKP